MNRTRIFISSVQSEFAEHRQMLADYIRRDALLGKFFEVFIFEEMPADSQSPSQVYLAEVEQCDIYLGLFGEKYGYEDSEGISPTEREYDRAAQLFKTRLVYLTPDTPTRHPKEKQLIAKAEKDIVRRTFDSIDSLRVAVYSSLVRYMEQKGIIRWRPFDASTDSRATFADLDEEKILRFLHTAIQKRSFAMSPNSSAQEVLVHLGLMDSDGQVTNAAVLLFGQNPQRFFLPSEVKCMQFYGTRVEKPVPSYQIYKGDLFQLVDQATTFVMSRINNWVGKRDTASAAVVTRTELPYEAVNEAIINAICHRDYTSNASVQVMLFRDRLEIWNPGHLPFGLTVRKLEEPHKSLPINPLIADSMFLCKYVEEAGTGTENIIRECLDYGLRKPEFIQEEDFRVTIWRPEQLSPDLGQDLGQASGLSQNNTLTLNDISWDKLGTDLGQNRDQVRKILSLCVVPQLIGDIMLNVRETNRTRFRQKYITPLLRLGLLVQTIPDKPTSSHQRYLTTDQGKTLLLQQ